MTDLRQAAQMALEQQAASKEDMKVYRSIVDNYWKGLAAAQPEQQAEPVQGPVAWAWETSHELAPQDAFSWVQTAIHKMPLYTAPLQRKPLTNTEFCEQWFKQTGRIMGTDKQLLLQAKRVTEAAHNIKEQL